MHFIGVYFSIVLGEPVNLLERIISSEMTEVIRAKSRYTVLSYQQRKFVVVT
jgi:hypothetical protein